MTLLRRSDRPLLVATHSAHVIDTNTDTLIAVEVVDGRSTLTPTADPALFRKLRALGYRASDLLQANSIIWVEGPSDRIYVKSWLHDVDSELQEGVDYSIVFYGGALLRRLSAATLPPHDPTLVDLWKVNQQMWLVMDKDTLGPEKLRPSVERLKTEIEATGKGGTWITKGYTIEDYIPDEVLLAAANDVHSSVRRLEKTATSKGPLSALMTNSRKPLVRPDKVAIAMAVTARPIDIEVLDLKTQIERLAAFIRAASA
jgi:hypothetical protein